MVGGQACEVNERKRREEKDFATLEFLHIHKTGMLIRASLIIPALLFDASPKAFQNLKCYGENLGLAFQIVDDIEDYKKGEFSHFSYPASLSLDECRHRALSLKDSALSALRGFGREADPLRHIASFVVERMHDKQHGTPKTKPEQSL